jgi:hypothetical protein
LCCGAFFLFRKYSDDPINTHYKLEDSISHVNERFSLHEFTNQKFDFKIYVYCQKRTRVDASFSSRKFINNRPAKIVIRGDDEEERSLRITISAYEIKGDCLIIAGVGGVNRLDVLHTFNKRLDPLAVCAATQDSQHHYGGTDPSIDWVKLKAKGTPDASSPLDEWYFSMP